MIFFLLLLNLTEKPIKSQFDILYNNNEKETGIHGKKKKIGLFTNLAPD